MPTSPRNPAAWHFAEAEHVLGDLGVTEPAEQRAVEAVVALTHAVLSVAATLAQPADRGGYDFERDH